MKTNFKTQWGNKFQKAITKSLAVVTGLVFVGISVNAQDFWKSLPANNSFNEIVDNNVGASSAITNTNAFSAYLKIENEEALKLEDWMRDETFFDANLLYLKTVAEKAMELEKWMTSESYFGNSDLWVIEETKNELKLEDWMLNKNLFNTEEVEQPLELDEWMINEKLWVS